MAAVVLCDHECFVAGVLARVLRLSKYLGIAPLRFVKRGNGWRIRPSLRSSVISCVVITAIVALCTWSAVNELLLEPTAQTASWTRSQRVVWFVDAVVMDAIAAVMVYYAPVHMHHLICCLNQVQKINFELNIHHWPKLQWKYVTVFVIWAIFIIVNVVAVYILEEILAPQLLAWTTVTNFLYYAHFLVTQIFVMQFVLVVMHGKSSVEGVNDCLRSLLRETSSMPCSVELLRRSASTYASVGRVVRSVNTCYGPSLCMILAVTFIHITTTPYFYITSILDLCSLLQHTSCFTILWTLLNVFCLLMMIEPCHLTHVEMATTRVLVVELLSCSHTTHSPLAVELEQFYKCLVLNNVAYRPLDIVTMTRGLVIQILGCVTTYLMILIKI